MMSSYTVSKRGSAVRGKHIIGPTFARGREPLGKSIHKFDTRATKNEMKKTILGKKEEDLFSSRAG